MTRILETRNRRLAEYVAAVMKMLHPNQLVEMKEEDNNYIVVGHPGSETTYWMMVAAKDAIVHIYYHPQQLREVLERKIES